MKNFLALSLSLLFVVSCSQIENGSIAYRITEKDLIPEGITYSATTQSFYVSSILKSKIIQIDAKTGEFKDFVTPEILEMRFLGMIVDDSRNHLWACGNIAKDDQFYSTVAKFNLTTGALIKSYVVSDSMENTYNDLIQDQEGDVYFTNYSAQTIYKIDQQTDSISIFFDSEQINHPNGIALSPDGQTMYVASRENGIRILDIESREIINEPDSVIISTGIDGLKYYKNSIIGLQNNVKEKSDVKIAQYILDATGTKIIDMKIIDQDNPNFDIPTTFVIVDNMLYCLANSQMGNLNWATYEIRDTESLDDVFILHYKL